MGMSQKNLRHLSRIWLKPGNFDQPLSFSETICQKSAWNVSGCSVCQMSMMQMNLQTTWIIFTEKGNKTASLLWEVKATTIFWKNYPRMHQICWHQTTLFSCKFPVGHSATEWVSLRAPRPPCMKIAHIGASCFASIGEDTPIFTTYGIIFLCAHATVVHTFTLGCYCHLRG